MLAHPQVELNPCKAITFAERDGAECKYDFGAYEAPPPLLNRETPATAATPVAWKFD
jgi:hypothetical protein